MTNPSPSEPVEAVLVRPPVPSVRCCAPWCGDKIRWNGSKDDLVFEVRWSNGESSYLEPGCVDAFVNGTTGYPVDVPGVGPVPGLPSVVVPS